MRIMLPRWTPWGVPSSCEHVGDRGCVSVTTPSHGGIGVPRDVFDTAFTEAQRAYCLDRLKYSTFGTLWCWFEEDRDALIPLALLAEYRDYPNALGWATLLKQAFPDFP